VTLDSALCPACSSREVRLVRSGIFAGSDLYGCGTCSTEYLEPQPSDQQLNEIYSDSYYEPWAYESPHIVQAMKYATFRPILATANYLGGERLLDLGCATGDLLTLAHTEGLETYGLDLNPSAIAMAQERLPGSKFHVGTLADDPFPNQDFDVISMIDFLEHVRSPKTELTAAALRLRSGGRVVISTPRRDSLTRRLSGRYWPQYRHEHLTYLSSSGIRQLAPACGLRVVTLKRTTKTVTPSYLLGQAAAYPIPVISPMVKMLWRLLPAKHRMFRLPFGEMTVVLQRK
jgi:SAM-dependent methyltransferase